jgi:1-acyl-sn-glycerol-3-phosphate acyltransferase
MLDLFARGWLALWRFDAVECLTPVPDRCVMIAAPHTSNWDFPLTLALAKVSGVRINWLGKAELFRGPMGPVMRRLGGIAVTRDSAGSMVAELVGMFATQDKFCLLVPVEGTRSRSEYWKSGFYRIARDADVPILFAFVDRATRTGGFGPALVPTGDVSADMDQVRAFYSGKEGLRSGRSGVPRLREEDRPVG